MKICYSFNHKTFCNLFYLSCIFKDTVYSHCTFLKQTILCFPDKSVNRWQFDSVNAAQRVSQLLGITVDKLTQLLFGYSDAGSTRGEPSELDNGDDTLEAFSVGLYSELFNVIGFLINRCEKPYFRN